MSVYARKTKRQNFTDVLITDNFFKKEALLKLIADSSEYHEWDKFLNLSRPIDDSADLKPSLRKKIMRRIKWFPLIRTVYNKLLLRAQSEYAQKYAEVLREKLGDVIQEKVELHLLTQTALNDPLQKLFPAAKVSFFEHGMGDYFYVLKDNFGKGDFYCVFADLLSRDLQRKQLSNEFVRSFIDADEFEKAIIFAGRSCLEACQSIYRPEKKYILFLMDCSEIYHPPEHFWEDYVKRCLQEVERPEDFCWLVKPHPNQSNGALEKTKNYFLNSGLDVIFLDDPKFVSLSAEFLFITFKDRVDSVFTTFSSAIFYLSHFYPQTAKYYLLYDFVGQYFSKAPKQYLEIFHGLNEFYTGMFADLPLRRIQ